MGGSFIASQEKLTAHGYLSVISKQQPPHIHTSDQCDSDDALGSGVTPYDAVLPRNESPLMAPVRRWEKWVGFRTPIIWSSTIAIVVFHVIVVSCAAVSVVRLWLPMWQTFLFAFAMGGVSGFGVTAGAHRYWCHRSYKARLPLQIILLVCYSVAGQNNIFNWVRDHRVHHLYSETDADPHDVRRGFFFSHVGWLMMRKHPAVRRRGDRVRMDDILADPLLRFHRKHFNVFKALFCFIIPTAVPLLCWGESWWYAVLSQSLLRYCISLHCTWSVNSFAHMFGNKPYDRSIMPSENWGVSLAAMGEGWHNYHHTFPWDYRAAELGGWLNITTAWLELFRRLGWVHGVRRASPALVRTVAAAKGQRKCSEYS